MGPMALLATQVRCQLTSRSDSAWCDTGLMSMNALLTSSVFNQMFMGSIAIVTRRIQNAHRLTKMDVINFIDIMSLVNVVCH